MRLPIVSIVAVVGCGNDVGRDAVDAAGVGGPPGSPMIVISGPRHNESFYPAQSMTIVWTATDDDTPSFPCDVALRGGLSIASAVPTTSGTMTSTSWAVAGVPAGTYQIQVTCTEHSGLVGSGVSPAFSISAPPQVVAYSEIQSLLNRSCVAGQCHDAIMSQAGLDLTASASYGELVNNPSGSCTSYQLVEPTRPDRSYLVAKLVGSNGGACFVGSRMPKAPEPALTAAEVQLVRDWIFNGAPR